MAAAARSVAHCEPLPFASRKTRAAALRRAQARLGVAAVALVVVLLAALSAVFKSGTRQLASLPDGRLFVLAFYFPQFHPIPENAAIYFEGFSDWALVRDAPDTNRLGALVKKPVPPLGYYDPREYAVRRRQSHLARDYGLDGFIYYHYWLENRLVMGEVIDRMLLDGQPDVPFALCWVNESWQRKFYGMERRVTFEQKFDAAADHATYLARVFDSPLYLRVNGQPLLIVYMRETPESYLTALQDGVEALTGSRMFIASCLMTLEDMYTLMPGADALVEFHPNLNPGWGQNRTICGVHPRHGLTPELVAHPDVGLPIWRGGLTGWDPTPRYPNTTNYNEELALAEGCPYPMTAEGLFNVTVPRLRTAMCEAGAGDALYAIFAWNEWGEGAVLEPNTAEGTRLGEAVARARRKAERLHGEDRAAGLCRETAAGAAALQIRPGKARATVSA